MTSEAHPTYTITYADGSPSTDHATYAAAVAALSEVCAEVGHSGDLSDDGDRTLAWRTAADAANDAGSCAYAEIRRRPRDEA